MEHIVNFDGYCFSCTHKNTDENEDPCNECLTISARDDSRKPEHYEKDNRKVGPGYYKFIRKVQPFLYSVSYDALDYEKAYRYFEKDADIPTPGACSAVRKGKLYGRNFDWYYSNQAEFIVRTSGDSSHFETLGIAGGFSKLTDEYVSKETVDDLYYILPFQLQDGINSQGLVMSINVVPADKGHNKTVPTVSLRETMSALMLIRFVLDNFASARKAANYIREHVSVYFPKVLHNMDYEAHFMLADRNCTYAIEFVDNETVIMDISDKPFMTNFHLNGVWFNGNGDVITPEFSMGTINPVAINHVTEHGSGLERYNFINNFYPLLDNKFNDMSVLMRALNYTRAYKSSSNPSFPFWYSEFVGGDIKLNSDISLIKSVANRADELYLERSRDTAKTWQTMHTSIYDLETLKLNITCQESNENITFNL